MRASQLASLTPYLLTIMIGNVDLRDQDGLVNLRLSMICTLQLQRRKGAWIDWSKSSVMRYMYVPSMYLTLVSMIRVRSRKSVIILFSSSKDIL